MIGQQIRSDSRFATHQADAPAHHRHRPRRPDTEEPRRSTEGIRPRRAARGAELGGRPGTARLAARLTPPRRSQRSIARFRTATQRLSDIS